MYYVQYTPTQLTVQVPLLMSSQLGKIVILINTVIIERLTADAKVTTCTGFDPSILRHSGI
jgi:hypothetical protein